MSWLGLVHQVLLQHPIDVAHFRRRGGYCWWCGCHTDGERVHRNHQGAWEEAARHQATQVDLALRRAKMGG